jgi:acetylornithine/N-succinyldiaminopimelate aminotransferase
MSALNEQFHTRWQGAMMNNYGTPPIALDHGSGVRVWDVDGKEYLDFIAGIATSALGHAHPAIVDAVRTQISKIAHTSNLFMHEPGIALAERLLSLNGVDGRVFFSNDGAEANECALKMTRRHGRALDPDGGRLEIVAAQGGFHGRTMGSLSITGVPAKREPFAPLPGPVSFVPYGDVQALRDAVTDKTAAVFLEPTLGEGGVVPPPAGYLAAAREICNRTGALLVLDEVQSGIGRTGNWFHWQGEGVQPDILTLAKGLGGGLPIGACIGFGAAAALFVPGDHGSTFGGNPVSCVSALAVLNTIASDGLLESVKSVGDHLADRMAAIGGPLVSGVRGSGLWRALVLTGPHASSIETAARAEGLLVNAVQPNAIRVAPPLILTEADADLGVARLAKAVADAAIEIDTIGAAS